MKRKRDNLFHIHGTIIVDRESKKGIIIGKGGKMLKQIGIDARKDIEELLGIRVMLELFVKVEKDWRDSMYLLKEYGYKDTE
jgi:GTP-binding protein Era